MSTLKRRAKWCAWQALFLWIIGCSIYTKSPGMARASVFLMICMVALAYSVAIAIVVGAVTGPEAFTPEFKARLRRPFPGRYMLAYDITVAMALVYFGWIFTALLWLSTQGSDFILYNIVPALVERAEKEKARTEAALNELGKRKRICES